MYNRAGRNGATLSLLIVSTLILGGLFAAILASGPVARAGACDQVGGVISGDWTITTAQVCSGIVYSVDGSVNINAGGSLTLINGGLRFTKDAANTGYSLNVNAGGTLILDGSIVTTEPRAIDPYVLLAFTVSGANSVFTMRNHAMLKFPGWFNATGATLNITDSTITGFDDSEIAGTGLDTDANNDGPLISWASTSASLYGSRIERIFEGPSAGDVTLSASSTLYAYDSYIGVDYSDDPVRHNALRVDGTSNAYLYGATIDRAQDPSSMSTWQPAFLPAAGGNVNLLRWAHVTTLDTTGFPVSGSSVSATLSPSATAAQYPDNGLATTPSSRTLWFLGRSASGANAWDVTGPSGDVRFPLWTDQVTSTSLPNADSFGNYAIAATFSTSTANGGVSFPAYPSISLNDNTRNLTLSFDITVRTGPDLELRQSDYSTTVTVIQNQPFTIQATIYNAGQTTATNTAIAAYLDGNRSSEVARVSGLTIAAGGSSGPTLNVAALVVAGAHTLMLWVDPDNTINEGGAAQEGNNQANVTLFVNPPPEGFVAIGVPDNGFSIQPGTDLTVTGFVRQPDSVGIPGVVLAIELRYQGNLVGTPTQTTSVAEGAFVGSIAVPSDAVDGSYTLTVTPTAGTITPESRTISVAKSFSPLNWVVPILGLPLWLFLIILAAVAAIGIGVTLYWKVFGLGKMVECGECGAFIPEDATSCPKCGVEFEKDMAKCSNCQAWIPVDVKQCPECGVEFASGQVEMADYQEKMRLQYDEVVTKFKEESSRQLGRALSDREFQEWWRKQPTFLTFEDWLREEEEMRKMGSKPCPTCGTLNSVTATVCHKCGSLMRETARPPSGGAGGGTTPVIQTRRPGGAPNPEAPAGGQASPYGSPTGQTAGAGGTEAIPRRVIRKPIAPQPLVQKKVIKKPSEGGEGEGQSDASGENQTDEDL